jgi:putative salt-induced outer membrane protein
MKMAASTGASCLETPVSGGHARGRIMCSRVCTPPQEHPPMQHRPAVRSALACLALAAGSSQAQVTQKPDGQWRSLFTAGASVANGNSDAKSASVGGDLIKLTNSDKWEFNGAGQYARSAGATTANRQNFTGLYNEDISPQWFGFGQLDLVRDIPSDLSSRITPSTGLGYHAVKMPDQTFDLSAGLAYTWDRYRTPQVVDDELRSRHDHLELLLAEQSNNKLSDTTTFKQKLTIYPSVSEGDGVRTVFDAGLSVAMTKQLALTATVSHRYDSQPGEGLKKNDTLFVTGVSLRFD